jgi:hypothetical protein
MTDTSYIGNDIKSINYVSGTEFFNGTGAQLDFNLQRQVASINDIDVVVENVGQKPGVSYTLANNGWTLRFFVAPGVGTGNIYTKYRAQNLSMVQPTQGSVGLEQLASSLQVSIFSGNRNRLHNPFTENQRALTSVGDDAYCLDRWYVLTESGNVTITQVADPEVGAPYALRMTQPDASAKRFGIAQIIEAKDIKPYRTQAMNLGARIKPSFSGNVRYAVLEHTGTADVVTSDVVNNWSSSTFTAGNFFIAGLNVLTTGVVTPGAATYGDLSNWAVLGNLTNNVVVFFWTESAQAQNAYLEINRPQFEPGVLRTPQEWRHNELALCQRYFWSSFAAVGSTPSGWPSNFVTTAGMQSIVTTGMINMSFIMQTPMRAAPSASVWDHTGTAGKISSFNPNSANNAGESGGPTNISPYIFVMQRVSGSNASSIGAYLQLSAEL